MRRADISTIEQCVVQDLNVIKTLLNELKGQQVITADGTYFDALNSLETFVAISLRIIAKTNPSKIVDEARTVEIQSLMRPA